MPTSSLPWWRTDTYDDDEALSQHLATAGAGPKDIALVRAWKDGRTDPGWGDAFMEHYNRGEFNSRRVLYGYEKGKWNFAIIMRSLDLVCIDIDGKNGGLDHAKRLGALPKTLAETSKSGDGYHLFYLTGNRWDVDEGYGVLRDRIGIEQGVDFRGTGCVYHHPQQRWNNREPVLLPDHLRQLLLARTQKQAASNARIVSVLASGDDMEVLMMHDEILSKLAKPIPAGKRNNTLFAIGSEMQTAGIADWDNRITERALALGLDSNEIGKLVSNIEKYATP